MTSKNNSPVNKHGEGLAPFPTSWRLAPPIQPCVWIGGLRRQSALGLFGQGRKTRRVVHGDIRQHLAVQGDAGLQQAVHETAVAQAVDRKSTRLNSSHVK